MHYTTGVYWCGGAANETTRDAVLLQQVLTRRGRTLIAAVCAQAGEDPFGEAVSGYVIKQLQEWFYGEFLFLLQKKKRFWVIRRSFERRMFDIRSQMEKSRMERNAVEKDAALKSGLLQISMTSVILYGGTFLLWRAGDTRAYRQQRQHMSQFATNCGMGVLRKGEGILLCTDGFCRLVSEREIGDVMRLPRSAGEEQIERRLKEIGGLCRKRGEKEPLSAIYMMRGT